MSAREVPYKPGPIGDPPTTAALEEELERIAERLARQPSLGSLRQAPTVGIGLTPARIENWGQVVELGAMRGTLDPVAGQVTVPAAGVYRVSVALLGAYSGSGQNDVVYLRVHSSLAAPRLADIWPLVSNSVNDLAMYGEALVALQAGEVLDLWINGTTALGTLTIENALFELEPSL